MYLRVETDDYVTCHLLMGKSKIAPSKKVSIPRLELCAACFLARVIELVQKNLIPLKVISVTTWTKFHCHTFVDKNTHGETKNFFANRVAKIQELTKVEVGAMSQLKTTRWIARHEV